MPTSDNIFPIKTGVSADERARVTGQRGCVVWFTGLSGSGKSTIASAVEAGLIKRGRAAYLLDGDNVRRGLCAGLGFSQTDRDENIRRIGEAAALFENAGLVCLVSAISPYEKTREAVRARCENFLLVYVKADAETCKKRDPKGLYARAERGEITGFTGVDSPYEIPSAPDLVLETAALSPDKCAEAVLCKIESLCGERKNI